MGLATNTLPIKHLGNNKQLNILPSVAGTNTQRAFGILRVVYLPVN